MKLKMIKNKRSYNRLIKKLVKKSLKIQKKEKKKGRYKKADIYLKYLIIKEIKKIERKKLREITKNNQKKVNWYRVLEFELKHEIKRINNNNSF